MEEVGNVKIPPACSARLCRFACKEHPQRLDVYAIIAELLFHRPLSKIGIILHRVVCLLIAPVLYIVTWNNERLANLGFPSEE